MNRERPLWHRERIIRTIFYAKWNVLSCKKIFLWNIQAEIVIGVFPKNVVCVMTSSSTPNIIFNQWNEKLTIVGFFSEALRKYRPVLKNHVNDNANSCLFYCVFKCLNPTSIAPVLRDIYTSRFINSVKSLKRVDVYLLWEITALILKGENLKWIVLIFMNFCVLRIFFVVCAYSVTAS